jgi:hypothetical protein
VQQYILNICQFRESIMQLQISVTIKRPGQQNNKEYER